LGNPVALKAALRHDTIRRTIEVDGRVSIAEAEIKQAMVRSAEKIVFLADHDKIGTIASAFVGDISCADLLVTDSGADPSALANLRAERLKVVTADPGAG
jgi:DeoR/GlpR family transcriptional regulator of sugar metabolism